jgi:hypothetical protein
MTLEKSTLAKVGLTAETGFIVLMSVEVAAKNEALLSWSGFWLGLGYIFSIISASTIFVGMLAHTVYNSSKLISLSSQKQKQVGDLFQMSQKAYWPWSIINVGFLFSKYFNGYGFLVGAALALLNIYDNAIFLSSCQALESSQESMDKAAFRAFTYSYAIASGFQIAYTTYVVYINLTYFAGYFMNMSALSVFIYSLMTSGLGALAKTIRNYQVFQNIKEKVAISKEEDSSTWFCKRKGVGVIEIADTKKPTPIAT